MLALPSQRYRHESVFEDFRAGAGGQMQVNANSQWMASMRGASADCGSGCLYADRAERRGLRIYTANATGTISGPVVLPE